MWAVAGLGNPDSKHLKTRHNAGFMAADELADRLGARWRPGPGGNLSVAPAQIAGQDVLLVKPLTYMNLSGVAVGRVLREKNIAPENLIVVHDDIDLETARIRIRKNGSAGGHKGVDSIIRQTGTRNFIRVKIGIGRDPSKLAEIYVLEKFRKDEVPLIAEAVSAAAQAVMDIITGGVETAMNRFNKK
ncbi:MAG: aminoacyl-tRNA hydrolase [Nitrospiraceae bacterium]|nr:aminoacyl-tRNA hydrolase [Nitrospiraceae bacterium]